MIPFLRHGGVMGADVSALLEAAVSQASEPVQPGGQPGPGGGPATQVPSLTQVRVNIYITKG